MDKNLYFQKPGRSLENLRKLSKNYLATLLQFLNNFFKPLIVDS